MNQKEPMILQLSEEMTSAQIKELKSSFEKIINKNVGVIADEIIDVEFEELEGVTFRFINRRWHFDSNIDRRET